MHLAQVNIALPLEPLDSALLRDFGDDRLIVNMSDLCPA